jgi:hypothetical protein
MGMVSSELRPSATPRTIRGSSSKSAKTYGSVFGAMLTPRFRFCPSVNASPASLGRPVAMSTSPRLVKLLAKPSWDWGPSSNGAENNAKPSSLLDRPLRDLLSLLPLEVLLVVDVCEHSYMAVHRSNPRCAVTACHNTA